MSTKRSSSPPTSNSRSFSIRKMFCFYRCLTFKQCMSFCSVVLIPVLLALTAAGLSIQQQLIANRNSAQKDAHEVSSKLDTILSDYIERTVIMRENMIRHGIDINTNDYLKEIFTPLTYITSHRLDLQRKRILFMFIVSMNMLKEGLTTRVALDQINFDNIDLSHTYDGHLGMNRFQYLNMETGSFVNASFNNRHFYRVSMFYTNADGAAFRRCNIRFHSFIEASLRNTDFTDAELFAVDFRNADLRGSNIKLNQLFKNSNKLTGAALPNGSIVPTENLFINDHYKLQLPHDQACQLGLLIYAYTNISGDVINVLTANGQDCYFAARLIFSESITQKIVEVPRYSTWFATGQARYCLRATLGLIDTDNKNVQNVSIIGRALGEYYEILYTGQLGPFTTIKTVKECWPVPAKTVRFVVELVFLNGLATNMTYEMFEFAKSQTFGLVKDIYLTTE